MARKPNTQKTERLTLSATPQIKYYLSKLVEIGLYGKTETEVANTLVAREIENLIERGHIKLHIEKKK